MTAALANALLLVATVTLIGCVPIVGFQIARQALRGSPRFAGRALTLGRASWIPLAVLVGSLLAVVSLRGWLESLVHAELDNCLAQADGPILVDGRASSNPSALTAVLRTIGPVPPHHSVALRRVRVTMHCGTKAIDLEVAQDSKVSNEYWVFYPEYRTTRLTEIGRIQSSTLAQALGQE